MTPDEAVVAVVDALEASGIRYMIVGSLASNFHGVPRSTRDADFVVELGGEGVDRLISALPAPLRLRRQTAFEAVTGTTRYLIELAGSPFVCELFVLSSDPHDLERFARRLRVTALGRIVFLASAEDIVVTKPRWAAEADRAKDREDIRNILAVQGAGLDWEYLRRWAAEHGTLELLEQIRASIVLP